MLRALLRLAALGLLVLLIAFLYKWQVEMEQEPSIVPVQAMLYGCNGDEDREKAQRIYGNTLEMNAGTVWRLSWTPELHSAMAGSGKAAFSPQHVRDIDIGHPGERIMALDCYRRLYLRGTKWTIHLAPSLTDRNLILIYQLWKARGFSMIFGGSIEIMITNDAYVAINRGPREKLGANLQVIVNILSPIKGEIELKGENGVGKLISFPLTGFSISCLALWLKCLERILPTGLRLSLNNTETIFPFTAEDHVFSKVVLSRSPRYGALKAPCSLDRYSDILPYEGAQLVTDGYINASPIWLDFGAKRLEWISAQGPMEHTVQDFWRMIQGHNIRYIFMLTDLEEASREKCYRYWPSCNQSSDSDHKVTCTKEEYLGSKQMGVVHRQMVCKGERSMAVDQYHLTNWNDHKSVQLERLIYFVSMVPWTGEARVLIHCSAGVGRSGTFMLAYVLYHLISTRHLGLPSGYTIGDDIICFLLERIREQRHGMVQTSEQFNMLYDFMRKTHG